MKNNIEERERSFWGDAPAGATSLMVACHNLRRKNIDDLTVGDLRMLIGQNIALDILMPLALNVLKENILAEGDFYEGDLLHNVLRVEPAYWVKNAELKNAMVDLVKKNMRTIEDADLMEDIKEKLRDAFRSLAQ